MTSPAGDPTRLRPADLAKLLSATGVAKVTAAAIKRDLAAGAPQNADGTINLLHFSAWLAQKS